MCSSVRSGLKAVATLWLGLLTFTCGVRPPPGPRSPHGTVSWTWALDAAPWHGASAQNRPHAVQGGRGPRDGCRGTDSHGWASPHRPRVLAARSPSLRNGLTGECYITVCTPWNGSQGNPSTRPTKQAAEPGAFCIARFELSERQSDSELTRACRQNKGVFQTRNADGNKGMSSGNAAGWTALRATAGHGEGAACRSTRRPAPTPAREGALAPCPSRSCPLSTCLSVTHHSELRPQSSVEKSVVGFEPPLDLRGQLSRLK